MQTDPAVRTYNPNVRVGNWNEEICLEEDVLKDFLEKQENGSLLIQRTQSLMQTLLAKTELSESICFGSSIMLINPGREGHKEDPTTVHKDTLPRRLKAGRPCTAVSICVDDWPVGGLKQIVNEPIPITGGSNVDSSCVRNTFKIVGKNKAEGDVLRYGDTFAFVSTLGQDDDNVKTLCLFADRIRLGQATQMLNRKMQGVSPVQLIQVDSLPYGSLWVVESFDPLLRMEHEGLPVPTNQPIIIRNCATGQHLAVLDESNIRTPFGSELSIGAQTYFTSHKAEQDNNYWIMKTKHVSEN